VKEPTYNSIYPKKSIPVECIYYLALWVVFGIEQITLNDPKIYY